VLLWTLIAATAGAGGFEVIGSQPRQLEFRFVLDGREGDEVRVDGLSFGALPLETELAEGVHTIEVIGTGDPFEIVTSLVGARYRTTEVDLAMAEPAMESAADVMHIQGLKPELGERARGTAPEEAAKTTPPVDETAEHTTASTSTSTSTESP